MMSPSKSSHASDAARYALLLQWGTRTGLLVLILTFTAYLLELTDPHVPLRLLSSVWDQPLARYLQLTATPTGWGWVSTARHADMNTLVGIALLATCSVPPLLAVIPLFLKRREFYYVGFCLLQVLILLTAASGLLSVWK